MWPTRHRRLPPTIQIQKIRHSIGPSSTLLREIFERVENAIGARVDCYGGEITPRNKSVLIYNKQSAFTDPFAGSVGSVLSGDSPLRLKIGEQWKVQLSVLRKRLVAPSPIHGDPQYFGTMLLEFRSHLVVQRHLVTAYGAPVGWIKGQDYWSTLKVLERQAVVRCDAQGEDRSRGPGTEDLSHVCPPTHNAARLATTRLLQTLATVLTRSQ